MLAWQGPSEAWRQVDRGWSGGGEWRGQEVVVRRHPCGNSATGGHGS
jgi:hypothetical protein